MSTYEELKGVHQRFKESLQPQLEMVFDLIEKGHHAAAQDVVNRAKNSLSIHNDFLCERIAKAEEAEGLAEGEGEGDASGEG